MFPAIDQMLLEHLKPDEECDAGDIFFFNDTATTEIYTLSLHDALPIYLQIEVPALSPEEITSTAAGEASSIIRERVEAARRSEEHTSELQSQSNLVCRLLLEKKNDTVENCRHVNDSIHPRPTKFTIDLI